MKEAVFFLNQKISEVASDLSIVEDSGWDQGRSGGRCITDFSREVVFSRILTVEELSKIKTLMQEKHCPGWTGVHGYSPDKNTRYKFSTTWDSSD